MPIHEKLRGRDFPTMRNYLRVTMINIHDELDKRLDAQTLVAAADRRPELKHGPAAFGAERYRWRRSAMPPR